MRRVNIIEVWECGLGVQGIGRPARFLWLAALLRVRLARIERRISMAGHDGGLFLGGELRLLILRGRLAARYKAATEWLRAQPGNAVLTVHLMASSYGKRKEARRTLRLLSGVGNSTGFVAEGLLEFIHRK